MSYQVRSGDTLWALAERYGTTLEELEKANPQLATPNVLQVGQALQVPAKRDRFSAGGGALPSARAQLGGSSGSGASALQNAQALLGTPYNFRGMYDGTPTPGQLHCAELTSAAYGGRISDSVYDQVAMLKTHGVPQGQQQAGDIACFRDTGYGVPHVGVLTDHGTIIHASAAAGRVVESPISEIPGLMGFIRP
jgi:LysM repeat protein